MSNFWIVLDLIAGDEPKIVQAPSKEKALEVAADAWSYSEESEPEARAHFVADARIVPLTSVQADALQLEDYVLRWERSSTPREQT